MRELEWIRVLPCGGDSEFGASGWSPSAVQFVHPEPVDLCLTCRHDPDRKSNLAHLRATGAKPRARWHQASSFLLELPFLTAISPHSLISLSVLAWPHFHPRVPPRTLTCLKCRPYLSAFHWPIRYILVCQPFGLIRNRISTCTVRIAPYELALVPARVRARRSGRLFCSKRTSVQSCARTVLYSSASVLVIFYCISM